MKGEKEEKWMKLRECMGIIWEVNKSREKYNNKLLFYCSIKAKDLGLIGGLFGIVVIALIVGMIIVVVILIVW